MNTQEILLDYIRKLEPQFRDCSESEIIARLLMGKITDLEAENKTLKDCNKTLTLTCEECEKQNNTKSQVVSVMSDIRAKFISITDLADAENLEGALGCRVRVKLHNILLKHGANTFPRTTEQVAQLLFILIKESLD